MIDEKGVMWFFDSTGHKYFELGQCDFEMQDLYIK